MGLLVEGKWQDRPVKVDSGGRFIRAETQWRDWSDSLKLPTVATKTVYDRAS